MVLNCRFATARNEKHSTILSPTPHLPNTMAPTFDLSTMKGVGSLNGYLSGRSYLNGVGFFPSRT